MSFSLTVSCSPEYRYCCTKSMYSSKHRLFSSMILEWGYPTYLKCHGSYAIRVIDSFSCLYRRIKPNCMACCLKDLYMPVSGKEGAIKSIFDFNLPTSIANPVWCSLWSGKATYLEVYSGLFYQTILIDLGLFFFGSICTDSDNFILPPTSLK